MIGALIMYLSRNNDPTEQEYIYSRQTLKSTLYIKPTVCPHSEASAQHCLILTK